MFEQNTGSSLSRESKSSKEKKRNRRKHGEKPTKKEKKEAKGEGKLSLFAKMVKQEKIKMISKGYENKTRAHEVKGK